MLTNTEILDLSSRIGKFTILDKLLAARYDVLSEALKGVIILEIRHDRQTEATTYIGMAQHFQAIDIDSRPPTEYNLIISDDGAYEWRHYEQTVAEGLVQRTASALTRITALEAKLENLTQRFNQMWFMQDADGNSLFETADLTDTTACASDSDNNPLGLKIRPGYGQW